MDSRHGLRFSVNEVSDVAMIPPPRRRAVLLFGHAGFAYGHVSRCRKIARRLVESSRSTPTSCRHARNTSRRKTTRRSTRCCSRLSGSVPPPSSRSASRSRIAPARWPRSHGPALRARGRLLHALAIRLGPHAVLLEGFPFVRPLQALEECGPTLAYLRQRSPQTLRCAGFNGVATSLWMGEHASLVERVLREQVDRLRLRGSRRTDGSVRAVPWLQPIEAKVRLTGYVVGASPDKADLGSRSSPRSVAAWTRSGRSPRRGRILRVRGRRAGLLPSPGHRRSAARSGVPGGRQAGRRTGRHPAEPGGARARAPTEPLPAGHLDGRLQRLHRALPGVDSRALSSHDSLPTSANRWSRPRSSTGGGHRADRGRRGDLAGDARRVMAQTLAAPPSPGLRSTSAAPR